MENTLRKMMLLNVKKIKENKKIHSFNYRRLKMLNKKTKNYKIQHNKMILI